jgi:peptidoglycan/LPS O-acetylase OafA/YrhL
MTFFEDLAGQPRTELRYRPDVDGLRALAIVPVVLYHYGFWPFTGGFVGVDVFFVISGFLITGLIHREMVEGRFSIRHFYERRIRRIFPALFVMLTVATVAAAIILFPLDFERYADSLFATAFFASNFEFWRETGYFDVAADWKPLLHLWSIAVEEQFYLIFPALLLLVGTQSRRKLLIVTGALFALSLAFSIWAVTNAPAAAFYLLPSRFWELMLGALLALAQLPQPSSRIARESIGIAGFAMIALAIFTYTRWQPFPGAYALLPCVGATLLIYAGETKTLTHRLLSAKPVVFIGLISYSLYLWHWPLLVFTQTALNRVLLPWEGCVLVALSVVLAILSWRFIEQPIRRHAALGRGPLFAAAASAMALTALCGFGVASANGLPQRMQPEIRQILAEERNHEPRMDICFGLTAPDVTAGRLCRIGSTRTDKPSFILWGDSHADALLPAVEKVAEAHGRAGLFAATNSCAPLLGVTRPDALPCKPFNDAVAKLALHPEIRDVILDARWSKNAYGTARGEGDGRIYPYDDQGQGTDIASTEAVFYRGLERTVRTLTGAGKHVIIVASVPEAGYSVPRVMAHLRMAGIKDEPTRDLKEFLAHQKFIFDTLTAMQKKYGVKILYPHQILCVSGACALALNDRPLYRDEHHLSVFGAMQLTPIVAQAF